MDELQLSADLSIKNQLENLHASVEKIQKIVDVVTRIDIDKLPTLKDKIDIDLFMVYATNALFWMYVKLKGVDPVSLGVKRQLDRVKEQMLKVKQAHERQTIRPKLDKKVAQRFVKHGLSFKRKLGENVVENKKIRFDD